MLAQQRKHASQSGMEQQRFVVPNQKMAELKIDFRKKDRDAVDVRRNFGCAYHGFLFFFSQAEKSSRL
ncbi:MAG: hypothetical protein ACRD28_08125 [Acidobacteriaceae bacterium]